MSTNDSRRSFLQNAGIGIGWLAAVDHVPAKRRAAATARTARAKEAATARHRQERDLSLHAGRPEPGGHLRSQAAAGETARPASAGQLRQRRFPERKISRHRHPRLETDVQDSTVSPASRSPTCFLHTSQHVDDLAIVRSCYHEGFTHSQAQFLINNGWPRDRPAEPRVVDSLRSRHRESESAGLCGAARGRRPLGSGGLRPGLPARRLSGHVLPARAQSDSQSHAAQRAWTPTSSATCSTRCGK